MGNIKSIVLIWIMILLTAIGTEAACPINCKSDLCNTNGVCDSCDRGYYGGLCEDECPEHCAFTGCEQTGGKCLRCANGFWGDTCEKDCEDYCKDLTCHKDGEKAGDCFNCNVGLWGIVCEIPCVTTCSYDNGCYRETGFCYGGCPAGFWSKEYCDKPCHHCANTCRQVDGYCDACDTPYCGQDCESDCPSWCVEGCIRETCVCDRDCGNCVGGACNPTDGTCSICLPGYFGDYCQSVCTNCKLGACDKTSGVCTSCADGYWKGNCDERCAGCDACLQTTGECFPSIDCAYGYFGENCDKCSDYCRKPVRENCNRYDGSCDGCADGFYGLRCEQSCATCLSKCYQMGGFCLDGCKEGWTGNNCEKGPPTSGPPTSGPPTTGPPPPTGGKKDQTDTITGSIIGVVLLLLLLIASIVAFLQSQKKNRIAVDKEPIYGADATM